VPAPAIQKLLLSAALILPTDHNVLNEAMTAQRQLAMGPQDAIIFTAVRLHLHSHLKPSFINKNTRDFSSPGVQDEFKTRNCPIIPTFRDGVSYVESHLLRGQTPPE
jgi:hypothetical protein